jgi:hypothetical protein
MADILAFARAHPDLLRGATHDDRAWMNDYLDVQPASMDGTAAVPIQ